MNPKIQLLMDSTYQVVDEVPDWEWNDDGPYPVLFQGSMADCVAYAMAMKEDLL